MQRFIPWLTLLLALALTGVAGATTPQAGGVSWHPNPLRITFHIKVTEQAAVVVTSAATLSGLSVQITQPKDGSILRVTGFPSTLTAHKPVTVTVIATMGHPGTGGHVGTVFVKNKTGTIGLPLRVVLTYGR